MVKTGLLELVGLAATLAIATPLVVFGVSELVTGEPIGLLFLGLAAGLFAVERILVTPGDLPGRFLEGTVGRAAVEPGEAGPTAEADGEERDGSRD